MYANEPEMAERWSAEGKKKKKKKGLERSAKDRAVEMVKA
jgi:hypothetical protein